MPETEQALADRSAAALWAGDTASQALGMVLETVSPGEASLSMPIGAHMLNGVGTCHGGFIFALADSAFAFACNSRNERTVAQSCSITYLQPARAGDRLRATARHLATAGRSGLYDVQVTGADGVVAEFRGQSRTVGGAVAP